MAQKFLWLSAVAGLLASVTLAGAQEAEGISCQPLPGTSAAAFACESIQNGSCSCPAGFVAVIERAPAAITPAPRAISGG